MYTAPQQYTTLETKYDLIRHSTEERAELGLGIGIGNNCKAMAKITSFSRSHVSVWTEPLLPAAALPRACA